MLETADATQLEWVEAGTLPLHTFEPITRTQLALYAGGSGDHNPLHVDVDFARSAAGMDDVIGHGMLTMALVARYLTMLAPQQSLRSYSLRFVGMTHVGDRIQCSGRVLRKFRAEDADCAEVEVYARQQNDVLIASGSAVVRVP